jgi:syntaxin-binding protein 1
LCRFGRSDWEAINNIEQLGIPLQREKLTNKDKVLKKLKDLKDSVKNKHPQEVPKYDLSRYTTQVHRLIESHVANKVDMNQYPYAKGNPDDIKAAETIVPQVTSLRSGRPTWQNKDNRVSIRPASRQTGSKIILFIAGGVSFSEIRSAYELAQLHGRQVIIGSTHLLTPKQFLQDLRDLRAGPPPPQPLFFDIGSTTTPTGSLPKTPNEHKSSFKNLVKPDKIKQRMSVVGTKLANSMGKLNSKVDKLFE